jgi:RHS repeat-associated protein
MIFRFFTTANKYCCLLKKRPGKYAWLFTAFIFVLAIQGKAQNQYPLVRTPQGVQANTELPKNTPAPGEPLTVKFSKDPTDDEIFRSHLLEIPLVPVNDKEQANENIDLVLALARFSQRQVSDDFSAITDYLIAHRDTRWKLSLLANLGSMYRKTGWHSKALKAWEVGWQLGKDLTQSQLHDITNNVVSQLAQLYANLGQSGKLDTLFNELKNRNIYGPAKEMLLSIKEGIAVMHTNSGIGYRCAPIALDAIQEFNGLKPMTYEAFEKFKSSQSQGNTSMQSMHDNSMPAMNHNMPTTLTQLKEMSDVLQMKMKIAKRLSSNAEIVMPCVLHWKTGHFSALVKKENGLYLIKDPTLGADMWLSKNAIDSEFSGYALIPGNNMPPGWQSVSDGEGTNIVASECDPNSVNKDANSCSDGKVGGKNTDPKKVGGAHGMASYSFLTMLVSLRIQDNPVGYTPPKGPPVQFSIVYNQREAQNQPPYNYTNLGTQWTFNFLSYLMDDPQNDASPITLFTRSGGEFEFNDYNSSRNSYAAEQMTQAILVRIQNGCYELRYNDGSIDTYSMPVSTLYGRKVFLTKIMDAAGNAVSISYDDNSRVATIKDALGQVSKISYSSSGDIYKITKITDPFGRSAVLKYDGNGRLKSITDVIGITSSFDYDSSDSLFVDKLTTPYGTTTFRYGETPDGSNTDMSRFLEATDPLGQKERLELYLGNHTVNTTEALVPVVANESFFNNNLQFQNSYFWDKEAMKQDSGNFSKAHIYHWLADLNFYNTSRLLHSEKAPLENRIWYLYDDQTSGNQTNDGTLALPRVIAQVIDTIASASTTQASEFEYNAIGNPTKSTDPIGRQLTYKYDSAHNIDLLSMRQTTNGANELLDSFTYNNQHLPLTAKDASGQTTNFTYNTAGQVKTITDPKQEKTTFNYNGKGYLMNITGPVSRAKVSFAYDGFGRVDSVTDSQGYTVATDYDALDRPTIVTYPDSTYEQIVYDKLDPAHVKDRLGRWSHTTYDKLRNPAVVQDALGRVTQFIWRYGLLEEIADPLKQITQFDHDIQGRVVSKIYDDNKTITYTYDTTAGRLVQSTDAKGQATNYSWYIDGNVKTISYPNALVPTDSVTFFYDSHYNRVDTMQDGTGITAYIYKSITGIKTTGAGMLQKIDGPLSNDVISYTYDELGRVSSRTINKVPSSVVYDSLGRITSANNALGIFTYNYVDVTNRLLSISYPNGLSTASTYFDNLGDQRLKEIWNKTGSTTLSKVDYEYNEEGQITKLTQQAGTATPRYYELGYDLADQLIFATQKNQNTNAILKRYAYTYDKAGNRTSEQVDNSVTAATYNTLNQMTAQQDGGPMHFKGTLSKFSSVLIKNKTSGDSAFAPVDSVPTNSFEAFVKVTPGINNNILIRAIDYSGNNNTSTDTVNVAAGHGTTNILRFDDNGNTDTVTNPSVIYSWDAADRLVKIIKGTTTIEFIYDGLSRRVAEKLNGIIIKRWVWCGTELCEERNATGSTVTRRFFPQGEQINGTNYYFTRDHLGSVREMTDASGKLITRYDYDPYGRRTRLSGNVNADFGFTGHYLDTLSNLYLAPYRAYDANLGRWLSRDPIGERAGPDLYRYVLNNPSNRYDPTGLIEVQVTGGIGGTLFIPLPVIPFPGVGVHVEVNIGLAIDASDAGNTKGIFTAQFAPLVGSGGAVTGGIQGGVNFQGTPTSSGTSVSTSLHGEGGFGIGEVASLSGDIGVERDCKGGIKISSIGLTKDIEGHIGGGAAAYLAVGAAENFTAATPSLKEIANSTIDAIINAGVPLGW